MNLIVNLNNQYIVDNYFKHIYLNMPEDQNQHYMHIFFNIQSYYIENHWLGKEKLKEKRKKHYLDNKDKIRKKQKEYRELNKEKIAGFHKKYYEKNKEKIKGLFVTHGHLDHIGGISHLYKHFEFPVFCSNFTSFLIKKQIKKTINKFT